MSGQTTWTGGIMSGTGTHRGRRQQPRLLLGASGDTNDVEFLTVRTLDVAGGGTLESQDTLEQSYGSTFVNTAADTLDVLAGVSWESDIDGTATIDNQGALVVGAGMGTATITGGGNFPFLTSPGGIGVLSGTLDLACNGTATGTLQASFTVAAGCTLQFGGDFTLGAGAGVGGPGIVEVPSGDLWFTSGASTTSWAPRPSTAARSSSTAVRQTGTLNESSGDLTGPGTLDRHRRRRSGPAARWTARAPPSPQGTLQIGLAGDTDDQEVLNGRTLTNAGAATWAGGRLRFSQADGGTFVNLASASFDIDERSDMVQ